MVYRQIHSPCQYSLQKIWTHGFHAAEDWTGRYFCLRQYLGFQIGLTDPKSWPLQLLYHLWNPPQFSHFLSSLIFPRRNPTERELLLHGHASQGGLNPLACTAKRCTSLVGTYICISMYLYTYVYGSKKNICYVY
jgi:hypothetical protein